MHDDFLGRAGLASIPRQAPEILQVNVGKLCNQTCSHCHVDAGPDRREIMTHPTAEAAIALLDRFPSVHTVDITGGAPELNGNFRMLVAEARARNLSVIDRCNLTILTLPAYRDLADFLAEHRVSVVASLPCYLEENVNKQRGNDVFRRSVDAIRLLNDCGYGKGTDRELVLVYNPVGTGIPPGQEKLEADYKRHLDEHHGVTFDRLITITNMPIARFRRFLEAMDAYDSYMTRLVDAFNPAALAGLMCRNTLNVGWDGLVYDCDFNQMLDLTLGGEGAPLTVHDLTPEVWQAQPVRTGSHCFGCTAGAGSSCGGALVGSR